MRAFATATISFGLVTIPVKVYASTTSNSVQFNLITKAGNRVKQKNVDAVTGEDVAFSDCLKGVEYAKDQYVTFTADELKAMEAGTNKTMAIEEFVAADSVDPIFIEKTYYLGPDKGGDRGYSLLSSMMSKLSRVAVAQWTSRNRDHLVVIRPYGTGLVLQQCFYVDEVRDFNEVEVAAFQMTKPEEVVAAQLIETLSNGDFDALKYEDRFAKRVRTAIDQKVAGKEIATIAEVPQANVMDMYEALKASLTMTKPAPKPGKNPKTK